MYLYTATDNRTMKRTWTWDSEYCNTCLHRFECFTDDRIHVNPIKVDTEEVYNQYRSYERFKAEFHLPRCLRLGLYKQIADTGYWSRSYRENFGDGFKLGAIVEEDEERLGIERSWVKFPNILYVTGTGRGLLV